jgi:predicted HTH domain antitoxin
MSFISAQGMSLREAVQILMQSPLYFKLSLEDRKILVQDFFNTYEDAHQEIANLKLNGSGPKPIIN